MWGCRTLYNFSEEINSLEKSLENAYVMYKSDQNENSIFFYSILFFLLYFPRPSLNCSNLVYNFFALNYVNLPELFLLAQTLRIFPQLSLFLFYDLISTQSYFCKIPR